MDQNSVASGQKKWRQSLAARSLFVFIACFFVLAITMSRHINIYDEGIVLVFSQLVASGKIVHRDFYSVYGPASYYAVAFLFRCFGESFMVARLFGLLVAAAVVTSVYALLAERATLTLATAFAIIALAWMVILQMYLYPVYPCLLFMLIGSFLLLRPNALQRSPQLIGAGACSGLAAYFRYDTGFFIMFAHCLAIALCIASFPPDIVRWRVLFRGCCLYGLGAGAVFLPGATLYIAHASISAFKTDIIDYPLHYYGRMRGLPFPGPSALLKLPDQSAVYFPILAMLLGLPAVLEEWTRNHGRSGQAAPLTVPPATLFACLTTVLYYKGVVRVSNLHMILSIVPSLLLLAVVADRSRTLNGRKVVAVSAILVAAMPALLAARQLKREVAADPSVFLGPWLADRQIRSSELHSATVENCLPGSRLALADAEARYVLVARYLSDHSNRSDRILVGLDRHDRVFINALGLYFLADRLPGTHWVEYDAGLQSRFDIQTQMIEDLKHNDVRWVVRDSSFDSVNEPNDSSKSSQVNILDDYIDTHFRSVAEQDGVAVWLRRDVSAPEIETAPEGCRMHATVART